MLMSPNYLLRRNNNINANKGNPASHRIVIPERSQDRHPRRYGIQFGCSELRVLGDSNHLGNMPGALLPWSVRCCRSRRSERNSRKTPVNRQITIVKQMSAPNSSVFPIKSLNLSPLVLSDGSFIDTHIAKYWIYFRFFYPITL